MTRPDPSKVTTIDPERDVVTLINTFTVQPENQERFIQAQSGEYKRLWGKIEGSLAANLHRGRSGRKAVNYAQLQSVEALRSWQTSDLMKDHLRVIQPYIERGQPGVYRVVDVVSRDGLAPRIEESETSMALIVTMMVEPGALAELVTAQGSSARRLLEQLPGLRSLTIHQGIQSMPRPAMGGGAPPGGGPQAPSDRPLPNAALYAQLDSEADGSALLEHPAYREWFTTENAGIHASEAEMYTVAYVQNEAASGAESPVEPR